MENVNEQMVNQGLIKNKSSLNRIHRLDVIEQKIREIKDIAIGTTRNKAEGGKKD